MIYDVKKIKEVLWICKFLTQCAAKQARYWSAHSLTRRRFLEWVMNDNYSWGSTTMRIEGRRHADSQLRSLQRRVKQWRRLEGPVRLASCSAVSNTKEWYCSSVHARFICWNSLIHKGHKNFYAIFTSFWKQRIAGWFASCQFPRRVIPITFGSGRALL